MTHRTSPRIRESLSTAPQLVAAEPPITLDEANDLAALTQASKAPATWRAYYSDMAAFRAWCADVGREPMPASPSTVALFLRHEAVRGLKVSSIGRRLSSLAYAHRDAGHPSPTDDPHVRAVWHGIRRTLGVAPRRVAPATTDVIRAMLSTCDDTTGGVRDRALLLIGFTGALRRSEVAELDRGDVAQVSEGLLITIRRSKTDQEGAGQQVAVPYASDPALCPVRQLEVWTDQLDSLGAGHPIAGEYSRELHRLDGPLFRQVDRHGNIGGRLSGRAVAEIVKRRAASAGLDPDQFSGHSLRAGFATSAAAGGARELDIARQTRHKSLEMLRIYVRRGTAFEDNAAARLGL